MGDRAVKYPVQVRVIALGLCSVALTGCNGRDNAPLLFVQTDSYGASVSAGPGTQGLEANVGYKGFNYASVPVTARDESGAVTPLNAVNTRDNHDAYSVFGHFSSNAGATEGDATQPQIGIGKFFATGLAARRLAEGFRYAIVEEAKK